MNILRHCDVERDLKNLKRFPAPKESLAAWERFFVAKGLAETPGVEAYKGLGSFNIYKARVVPLKENCGKSNGYRLIFQLEGDTCLVLVFSRHGIYKSEQELINTIKSRLI
jgi:hypothetical protein